MQQKSANRTIRRPLPYSAPRLMRYGSVRDLTAGGSVGAAEGAMMTNMMRHV